MELRVLSLALVLRNYRTSESREVWSLDLVSWLRLLPMLLTRSPMWLPLIGLFTSLGGRFCFFYYILLR